jgi:hypothetical protein
MYFIQHCFICSPSDSTVSKDARIEPSTVRYGTVRYRTGTACSTYTVLNILGDLDRCWIGIGTVSLGLDSDQDPVMFMMPIS